MALERQMTEDEDSLSLQRASDSPLPTLCTPATWHAPNGQVYNQVDFILTSKRFTYSINKANTRSFPGADIGSDHGLVLTTFKLKLKTRRFTTALASDFT